jgi:formiminotetrahydrofolate cyclodeaminase
MQDSFLDDLRRPRPDPGGGAAAAHAALMGMALGEKIILLERNRSPGKESYDCPWERLGREGNRLTAHFMGLRNEDVQAYHALAVALRAKEDPIPVQHALDDAIRCPLKIMRASREALMLVGEIGRCCRSFLVADVLVACELLGAALLAAHHIGSANIPLSEETAFREKWSFELSHELDLGKATLTEVRARLEVRHGSGGR